MWYNIYIINLCIESVGVTNMENSVSVNSLNNLVAVKEDGNTNIIGRLMYFMIGKAFIPSDTVKQIVEQCGIGEDLLASKFVNTHAFKSATKSLEMRRKCVDGKGKLHLYRIRVLDNQKEADGKVLVREIKKETIKEKMNPMVNLGNFIYDKESDTLKAQLNQVTIEKEIETIDDKLDLKEECQKILQLFELAKTCYNENRLVTFVENFIMEQLDASPINVHGKLFFIPKYKEAELSKLEMFMQLIEQENLIKEGTITFAAIPVMSEEKYVKEYAKEFYDSLQDDLDILMTRFDHFITKRGTASEKVISIWVEKYNKLMEKKNSYEELFQRKLDNLNEDIDLVDMQVKELKNRIETEKGLKEQK